MRKLRDKMYTNSLFKRVMVMYAVVVLIIGFFACYFSYSKENAETVSQLDISMTNLNHEYLSCTEDFWRLYMPIYQNRDSIYMALKEYFTMGDTWIDHPVQRYELVSALQVIMSNDNRIKWIGLYAGQGENNCILFSGETSLIEMPTDFPFIEAMENKGPSMEIYGSEFLTHNKMRTRYFAICGGTSDEMNNGKIIVGYATDEIFSSYASVEKLRDVRFVISNDLGVIYDSLDEYKDEYFMAQWETGICRNSQNEYVYIRNLDDTGYSYQIYSETKIKDMLVTSHYITPYFIIIIAFFCVFSLLMYRYTSRAIVRNVDAIRYGLERIGENDLDYRIPLDGEPKDEFQSIADSINVVSGRLKENINKASIATIKRREAELAELQAKFDPHFLYNTLQVIKGRVSDNGDEETADIIVKLAQIFRSFIGSDRFVPIQEEIEFCSQYLSLLQYRYEDQLEIVYDIDDEILEYGIIRNLLQPIIENYFIHGIDPNKDDNTLFIRGMIVDESYIHFVIEDNGLGISQDRIEQLANIFESADSSGDSSYGLKNIRNRVKLFYGQECGLTVNSNKRGGTSVEVRIQKLSCEEHQGRMNAL